METRFQNHISKYIDGGRIAGGTQIETELWVNSKIFYFYRKTKLRVDSKYLIIIYHFDKI